ncbi:hypothetical protein ON010_g1580 [Phytophthora cinnamomi]|nr:hypothetical protein ON010_g1580 [Phytophthora cinnamomi]
MEASGMHVKGGDSKEHVFVVGVTTKVLLRSAKTNPASVILQDGSDVSTTTQPLSSTSQMGLVHHLVLFVMSQLDKRHFTDAFAALRYVTGERMRVWYVIVDVDAARFNAVQSVSGVDYAEADACAAAAISQRRRSISFSTGSRTLASKLGQHCCARAGTSVSNSSIATASTSRLMTPATEGELLQQEAQVARLQDGCVCASYGTRFQLLAPLQRPRG